MVHGLRVSTVNRSSSVTLTANNCTGRLCMYHGLSRNGSTVTMNETEKTKIHIK